MIIGRQFVWLHFPKTAGHAVDHALKHAGGEDITFDGATEEGWHDTLETRRSRDPGLDLSGKVVISGFRRLPYWLLSRVHYEAARPPYLIATRDMMRRGEFFERNGLVSQADRYATHYKHVDRWLRMEHLAEDFEREFVSLISAKAMQSALRKIVKIVNGTRLNYIRDLSFYFTPTELASLYEANPVWAAQERALYGDILRLKDRQEEFCYFTNRSLEFVAVSPATLDLWGKSIDDVEGRHILQVFPKAMRSEPYEAHITALKTMRPINLKTQSPTFERTVMLQMKPGRGGLKVDFQLDPV